MKLGCLGRLLDRFGESGPRNFPQLGERPVPAARAFEQSFRDPLSQFVIAAVGKCSADIFQHDVVSPATLEARGGAAINRCLVLAEKSAAAEVARPEMAAQMRATINIWKRNQMRLALLFCRHSTAHGIHLC